VTFSSFEKVRASKLNLEVLPGTIVGVAQRITDSSLATSATDIAVLELPDIAITAGRRYEIRATGRIDTSVAANLGRMRLRYTTDGSTPSTSSTVMPNGQSQASIANTAFGEDRVILCTYVPAGNETLSLLLCLSMQSGSGNVVLQADGTSVVTEIVVIDRGVDTGDTGIDR
jgi:hypothetical protein